MPYLALDPAVAADAAPTLGAPLVGGVETLETLTDELYNELGGASDIDPARLTRWINEAYLELATMLKLPDFNKSFQFNTVAGQPLYKVGTQILSTERASIIDSVNYSEGGIPLKKSSADHYRRLPVQNDEPTEYFFEGNLIVLWPTPVGVRTVVVDAYILPQRLSDPDHSPIISDAWTEALRKSARSKGFDGTLEFQAGAQAENKFISHVRRKIDTDAEERTGVVARFIPARHARQLRRDSGTDRG